MIKLLTSYLLFYIGDLTSRFIHIKPMRKLDNRFSYWLAEVYQWCMSTSVKLDTEYKIWKIPEPKRIPRGHYCYDGEGMCPYYKHKKNILGYCSYFDSEILDQVKDCGINDEEVE